MANLEPLELLVAALAKLPGVGRRSAERMAYKVARDQGAIAQTLINALQQVQTDVIVCGQCGNITSKQANPCRLCSDPKRDDALLCVVEDPSDITTMEKVGAFRGRYHALMGKISPMKGEGIKDIRVESLLSRLEKGPVQEVILALGSDVESDATASFLHEILSKKRVRVTRLAFGLPAGSGLAYSDPVTLGRALKGRQEL